MGVLICNSENIVPHEYYLAHHGILNQRWGKKNGPPYPLNRAGKAAFKAQVKAQKALKKLEKKEKRQRKAEEDEQKRLEKKRNEYDKRQAQLKTDKERIMRSAPAEELVKYRGLWTNEELQVISRRLELEKDINSYVKPPKTGWDKMEDVGKKVEKIANFGEKSIKLYNVIAKIHNASNERARDKNPNLKVYDLPIVGGGGKKNNPNQGEQKDKKK